MIGWLTILAFIIIGIVLFKIIKSVIKTIIVLALVFLVISGIFIFFMVKDMNEFQESFPTAKKLFVLQEDGNIIGATTITDFSFGEDKGPAGYSPEGLMALNQAYSDGGLEAIKGDHYIIFLFTRELFQDGLSDQVPIGDSNFSKQVFIDALYGEEPSSLLVMGLSDPEKKEMARAKMLENMTEEDIRALLMMSGFSRVTDERGVLFTIDMMKKEQLVIYPEYMVFTVAKKTPRFLLGLFMKGE